MADIEKRPLYDIKEIARGRKENEEADRLFKIAEKILAKPLTFSDIDIIYGFFEWYKLPPAVICVLLEYCAANGKTNLRYMEKVAESWAKDGILTVKDAEEYIELFNISYRTILRAMGAARRDPTEKELQYMKNWINTLKMPLELVKEACERALLETGKANFKYADKIITSWHEQGVLTMEQVEKADAEHKEANKNNKSTAAKKGTKNKFNNFNSRSDDYSELERIEREMRLKKLNEE